MKRNKIPKLLVILALFPLLTGGESAKPLPKVAFNQKLGEAVPRDILLTGTDGNVLSLGEILRERPLILGLGYNSCPMLCSQQLQGMIEVLEMSRLTPGEDYALAFVSIDPEEPLERTREAEQNFRNALGGADNVALAFFRAGAKENRRLADAVGFVYTYLPDQEMYAHPAGWVILTPEGRVSAYEFGVRYEPADLEAEVAQARGSRIGGEKPSLLMRCLQYNPLTGPYGSMIAGSLKAFALGTVLAIGLFAWRLERRK